MKIIAMLVLSSILAAGCGSGLPPEAGPPPDQVTCEQCRKRIAREGAKSDIDLEGMDVYTCKDCLSKPQKAPRPRR